MKTTVKDILLSIINPPLQAMIIIFLASIICLFLFYLGFVNHVDYYEIGLTYDGMTGEIKTQPTGWHVTPIYVKATTISLLPHRYVMNTNSQAQGIANVKIAKFKVEGLNQFLEREGFQYYGACNMDQILKEYIFSGKEWPFLEIEK